MVFLENCRMIGKRETIMLQMADLTGSRRQGRGNSFPLPVSPTPNRDIPTVQCQGIGGKEPDTDFPPAPPRARLLT